MNIRKISQASILAAIVCVATMISVPLLPSGYINLGDAAVLFSAYVISPAYAFFAAAIGSSITDLILGYPIYIPATFLIKGIMALVFSHLMKNKSLRWTPLAAALSEIIMILGYYIYDGILLGSFLVALEGVAGNAIQGAAAIILTSALLRILSRAKRIK